MNQCHTYDQPPWLQPRTAYLHIPFCQHHCGYCDFAVTAGQDYLTDQYLDVLELELQQLGAPRPVETIFIGGGTPTYLTESQLEKLLVMINEWLPPAANTWAEATIESTPDSITQDKLDVLARGGINRISIGVQSFQGHTLLKLDRVHRADTLQESIAMTRKRIPNISLDLMFGVPEQSLSDWKYDLTTAIHLNTPHLSIYGLTYEKGTPLWKNRQRGLLRPVTEDVELEMFQLAQSQLGTTGYVQYELSNYAVDGYQSLHNQRYWSNHAYYGFGVGAARYIDGIRSLNIRNTKQYISRMIVDRDATFQQELLAPRPRAFETIATQLRRAIGIHRGQFTEQTSFDLNQLIGSMLQPLIQEHLIIDDGIQIALTTTGRSVADSVIEYLMKSLNE